MKNIDKIERNTGYDINNDGLIAEDDFEEFANGDSDFNQDERSPLFRKNQAPIANILADPLA